MDAWKAHYHNCTLFIRRYPLFPLPSYYGYRQPNIARMPQTEAAAAGANGVANTSTHEYAYVREGRRKREREGESKLA